MMAPEHLTLRTELPVPARTLWQWHTMRGAFERLAPPWERTRVLLAPDAIADGTQAVIELRKGPIRQKWVAEHFDVHAGRGFSDRQLMGPFASWEHHHRFLQTDDEDRSLLEDEIHYRVPFGRLGRIVGGGFARRSIERLLAYRHAVTRGDATRWWGTAFPRSGTILVTGHHGMIGRSLTALLRSLGYTVRGLTRHPREEGDYRWDPARGELDPAALEGLDAVVHLAGENIAGGRWTAARRTRILESRRQGTSLLAASIAALETPPRVLVSASGISAYPADGELHDESGPGGEGFLAEVSRVWESAADPARAAGVRVVHPRFGIVLSPAGGALAKMLPAFQAGLGGPLGGGEQAVSWVGLDDVVDVLLTLVENPAFAGPVNVVAPERVTQREFAQVLGRVLRRPAVLPAPAAAIRLALGRQMADETLLADLAVDSAVLREQGYTWRHARLEDALRHLLGRA